MREHALELTEVEFRLAITALCGSQRLDDATCVGLGDTGMLPALRTHTNYYCPSALFAAVACSGPWRRSSPRSRSRRSPP